MTGADHITAHFTYREAWCRDGTPYPLGWIPTRLFPTCEMLETIRAETGGKPLVPNSWYRTLPYNRRIGSKDTSQHVEGRAADIRRPGMTARRLHELILSMYYAGKLPLLGGLGLYPTFVHVDIRPGTRLARWNGTRTQN